MSVGTRRPEGERDDAAAGAYPEIDVISLDRVVAIQRNIYLIALLLGAVAALTLSVSALFGSRSHPFELPLLPAAGAAMVGLAFALWRRPKAVAVIGPAVYFLAAGLLLVMFWGSFLLMERETGRAVFLQISPWVPVVFVLGFLTFSPANNLRLSLAYLLLLLLPAARPVLSSVAGQDQFPFLFALSYFYAANLVVCVLLATATSLRAGLLQARNDAAALAARDYLTQAASRWQTADLLARHLEVARTSHQPLSVVMFDLDRFKAINDRYGHVAGDQALAGAARQAWQELRGVDVLGRWGGDEFVALLPETPLEEALQVAERMRSAIAEHLVLNGEQLTGSFGVAQYGEGDTGNDLLSRADLGLYQAKLAGGNEVRAGGPLTADPVAKAPTGR